MLSAIEEKIFHHKSSHGSQFNEMTDIAQPLIRNDISNAISVMRMLRTIKPGKAAASLTYKRVQNNLRSF